MSDKLSDPNERNGSGLKVGFFLLILAALVFGGYYYYTNHMEEPQSQMEDTAAAAGDKTDQTAENETAGKNSTINIPPFEGKDVQPGNPVVAKVNGKDITRLDVFQFVQQLPAQLQQLPPQQVYPIALEQVINNKLLQEQADKSDLETSPAFQEQMEQAKSNILRVLYVQDQMSKVLTKSEIEALYKEKVQDMPDTEERHARHILVESEDEAKKIIEELKGGADFAEMAKKHSKGPTGEKGGDLGWFAEGEMVPEFSNAAFKATPGSLIETPVKTQFGWHVVKVEESRTRPKPTLDEMRDVLKSELQREKIEELVMDLRNDADITVFDINGNEPGTVTEEPSAGEEAAPTDPQPAPAPAPQAEQPAPPPAPAPADQQSAE